MTPFDELLLWNRNDVLVEHRNDNYYAPRTDYCVVRTAERFELYHTVKYIDPKQIFEIKMFHAGYPHVAIEMHTAQSIQEVKDYILQDVQIDEQEAQSRAEIQHDLYQDFYGFSHY